MISGVGTDIVEVDRIREAVHKWGEKFLKRVFSKQEIDYCFSKRDPFPHLSARFAAKEAAVKALSGTSMDQHMLVSDVEVRNEASGKPYIVLDERIREAAGKTVLHVTLSHEKTYALATVIAEKHD